MTSSSFHVYDTTLRDGCPQGGISLSLAERIDLARILDDSGVTFMEGGWAGANPADTTFFEAARFGSPPAAQASDLARRSALLDDFTAVVDSQMADVRMRILDHDTNGTARVRASIDTTDGNLGWTTVGVGGGLVAAAQEALVGACRWGLVCRSSAADDESREVLPDPAAQQHHPPNPSESGAFMRILTAVLWTLFGVLQFVLAITVLGANPLIAALFAVAGLALLFGLFRRLDAAFLGGVLAALAAPVAVGLTGIEQFEWIHHVVRWTLVALMLVLWARFWRAVPTVAEAG